MNNVIHVKGHSHLHKRQQIRKAEARHAQIFAFNAIRGKISFTEEANKALFSPITSVWLGMYFPLKYQLKMNTALAV